MEIIKTFGSCDFCGRESISIFYIGNNNNSTSRDTRVCGKCIKTLHNMLDADNSASHNKQMDAIAVSKKQAIEFAIWWYGPESSGQFAKDGFETWWAQQHH